MVPLKVDEPVWKHKRLYTVNLALQGCKLSYLCGRTIGPPYVLPLLSHGTWLTKCVAWQKSNELAVWKVFVVVSTHSPSLSLALSVPRLGSSKRITDTYIHTLWCRCREPRSVV